MTIRSTALATLLVLPLSASTSAHAESNYFAASLGYNNQSDSTNQGVFTSGFTIGQVTGVNTPLDIPAGAAVGWNTQFDSGIGYSLAYGWHFSDIRFEVEYAMSEADVNSHTNVSVAGLDLGGINAGVLIAGNMGNLSVSAVGLVANGRGEIDSETLYVNAYYDFGDNSSEANVPSVLLPASFNIENESIPIDLGLRFDL